MDLLGLGTTDAIQTIVTAILALIQPLWAVGYLIWQLFTGAPQ